MKISVLELSTYCVRLQNETNWSTISIVLVLQFQKFMIFVVIFKY